MTEELYLKDIRTNPIIRIDKTKTVYDSALIMRENNISSIIAIDKNTIAGIITERDIVYKIVCEDKDPRKTRVDEVMSSPVQSIDTNKTVVDAARTMRKQKVKQLLVIDGREVKGIISEHDILEIDPALHRPDE